MKENNTDHPNHYLPICMCLGMSLGTAIGVATDKLSMCMCLGVSFGVCIGALLDDRNRKKTKENSGDSDEETV